MSNVVIASFTLSNWRGPTSGVELRLGLDVPITTPENENYGSSPLVVARAACTVNSVTIAGLTQYTLTIPAISLPATQNALVGATARYTAAFHRTSDGGLIQAWPGFESFSLPSLPNPTTWGTIRIANEGGILRYADQNTFTRSEILSLLNSIPGITNALSFRIGAATDSQSASFDLLMGSDLDAPRLRWTGSDWQFSFDGVTFKSVVVDQVKRVINPLDLGASRDGSNVGATTAAILAAIILGKTNTGYTVHLPAGTYGVNQTLTVPGGVLLTGDGRRKTWLYSTANAVIVDAVTGEGTFLFRGPVIRDLGIRGSKTAGSNQIGLQADANPYMAFVEFSSIDVELCGSHGVSWGRTFSSRMVDVFSNDNNGYPFLFNSSEMPANHFASLYPGDLNAPYLAGFRVRGGDIILRDCNGINSSPSGSWWAIVGDKIGVDGAVANVAAYLGLDGGNVESSKAGGVWLLSNSVVDFCGGKVSFVGDAGGSGSYKAILSEVDTGLFPTFFAKGRIGDHVTFANSPANYYANSMPIHCNDVPRLVVSGQGPKIAGGAAQVAYYNSTRSRQEMLYRADAFAPIVTVTTSTSFQNPGARYFEITLGADGALTLPWPGWYQPASEPVYIKNLSANGINVTINANSGGTVNGSSIVLNQQGDSLILMPNSTALDYRLIARNP